MMLKASARRIEPAPPCSFVVFGASGDLTHRLLVPALYNLAAEGLLPEAFALIGVARTEMSNEAFREDLRKALHEFATRKVDEKVADRLLKCVSYVDGAGDDEVTYKKLGAELERVEKARGTEGNRLL
jgi:glucose-6-phosphate 1-dehydrogenase